MRSEVVSRADVCSELRGPEEANAQGPGGWCALDEESSFVTVLKCLPPPLAMNAGDSHRRDAANREERKDKTSSGIEMAVVAEGRDLFDICRGERKIINWPIFASVNDCDYKNKIKMSSGRRETNSTGGVITCKVNGRTREGAITI